MAKVSKLETPSLRVSRPVSACQRCRAAKTRCDGKLPACSACERSGRSAECANANDSFAKGKERSYVASLEARIEKLEKQVAQAKARKAASSDILNMVSAQTWLSPPTQVPPGHGKAQRKEASNIDDLVSDFGFLSVNATSRDFHGFTREMSFARLVLSASSLGEMPSFTPNPLPQRYAIAPLIEHYLENINVLYPFLTETMLYGSIDAVCQDGGRNASPMDHWTARLVLAIALASQSRRRGDTQYQDAVRHASSALDHVEEVVHPGSVPGIQALVLLVLYSMLDPHHFKSWYLIGLASRAMVDIGLHQDPPAELQLKESELEVRRRVYFCVYNLDRSISMAHSRSFSFTDESGNVTPPKFREISMTTHTLLYSLDPALQLGHLRRIQSNAYQKLFQSSRPALEDTWPFMATSIQDMHRWWVDLPETIVKPMKQLLRCEVLSSSILLLSPTGLEGTLNEYAKFLIFEYAFEYAEMMSSFSRAQGMVSFYTCHDLLRTSYVADRFLDLLLKDSNLLFSGLIPDTPFNSPPPPDVPAITSCGIGEMVNRARRCLNLLERVFEWLGPRFGRSTPLDEFQRKSRTVRQSLEAGYTNWTSNPSIGLGFTFPGGPMYRPPR